MYLINVVFPVLHANSAYTLPMQPPPSDASLSRSLSTPDEPVDGATWHELLSAFRERPDDIPFAAKRAAVPYTLAEKAFRYGFGDGWPAIRAVLEDELLAVRARLDREQADLMRADRVQKAREEAALHASARKQAVEARTQEGQMIQFARADTLLALNAATKVLNALSQVGDKITSALVATPPSPEEFVKYLRITSAAVRASADAAKMVMEMERLHLGQPTQIIGLTAAAPADRASAFAELEEALESLGQAKLEPSESPIRVTVVTRGSGKAAGGQ